MQTPLSQEKQKELRSAGVINQFEVAYQVGDLYIAEDVVTKISRTINPQLNERRILKG